MKTEPNSKAGQPSPPVTLLDLEEVTTLYFQPVLSIQKLRSIATTLSKATPSLAPQSGEERGILLSEDLMQTAQHTKGGRKRVRQHRAVSWAILYYVPNAYRLRQSAAEDALQLRSVRASIRRIRAGKERGYSLGELLCGIPQQSELRREASRKPEVKRRHSYMRAMRSNDPSSATRRTGRDDCKPRRHAGFAAAHG